MINQFNLRVYGLAVNERSEILLVEEAIRSRGGQRVVKFPGGGVELGEGIREALQREWREETGRELQRAEPLYYNDEFVASFFHAGHQIVCFYYRVWFDWSLPLIPETGDTEFVAFRWQRLDQLKPEHLSLPTDQQALRALAG
jgi:8-oxo-dGTP pyrophosphatase MutT (NUDIX family)